MSMSRHIDSRDLPRGKHFIDEAGHREELFAAALGQREKVADRHLPRSDRSS